MNIIIKEKLLGYVRQNNIFFTCSTLFYISLPSLHDLNGYFHSVRPVERLVLLGITNYTVQVFIYQFYIPTQEPIKFDGVLTNPVMI